MKRLLVIMVWLLSTLPGFTQNQTDTTFSFTEFLKIVKEHHPVAYQIGLKQREGEAYVLKAKGGFDPKIDGRVNQKYFDDKQYYSYINSGLKIPTWFGIEAFAGYNNNDGTFLNPESYNVPAGIWNAGLSVNLGRGLFIDQRRADIKQAQIIRNSTELEQKIMLNQLIFEASVAYLEWNKSYQKVQLYEQNITVIQERFENIIQSVDLGDKPAVDTLKVGIQIQDRSLKLTQAKVELANKKELLNTFLWQDGFIPLEIGSILIPRVNNDSFNLNPGEDMESLIQGHPEVLMEQNNISISKIDYRLKRENLKPAVQLKYNALASDIGNGVIADYNLENYTWGATISYPIFTRKERAEVELARLKLETNQTKLVDKRANIEYKVKSTFNNLNSLKEQIEIQKNAIEMYEQLLDAEQRLFDLGESSLFLINTRDQNLINARIKLIDVNFNYNVSEAMMKYISMREQ